MASCLMLIISLGRRVISEGESWSEGPERLPRERELWGFIACHTQLLKGHQRVRPLLKVEMNLS